MKIGDLARRTGSTTRQLRYYEEQGLLEPDRSGNNYRDYGDEAIEQVRQIKILVGAGRSARSRSWWEQAFPPGLCVNCSPACMAPPRNSPARPILRWRRC